MNDETVDIEQVPVEVPVEREPEAEVKPKPKKVEKVDVPTFVRAEAGDSYLSLAVRYFPHKASGVVAPELVKLNRNRPVREGVKIQLKEIP
jgi:hypothetical protein